MLSSWSNMSYKINYFVILNGMAWWFIANEFDFQRNMFFYCYTHLIEKSH